MDTTPVARCITVPFVTPFLTVLGRFRTTQAAGGLAGRPLNRGGGSSRAGACTRARTRETGRQSGIGSSKSRSPSAAFIRVSEADLDAVASMLFSSLRRPPERLVAVALAVRDIHEPSAPKASSQGAPSQSFACGRPSSSAWTVNAASSRRPAAQNTAPAHVPTVHRASATGNPRATSETRVTATGPGFEALPAGH